MFSRILQIQQIGAIEKNILMELKEMSNDYNTASISLVNLSNRIGITKPTLIRHMNTLVEKGYLEKNNPGGRYSKNVYKVKI